MYVISTSNLVSSEAEKETTACNFQTMAMNCFIMPHALIRGQIRRHAYYANMKLFVVSWR